MVLLEEEPQGPSAGDESWGKAAAPGWGWGHGEVWLPMPCFLPLSTHLYWSSVPNSS